MANFLNYIVESSIQPVKTNVLWIKNGVPYYFNKKWKPLLGSGSGGGSGESVDSPIQFGEGEYSAVLKNSNSRALNDYALALGYNTVSNNPSETAFGRYNKSIQSNVLSEATLFSIGNGSKDKFSNALEVKYDGSLFLQNLDKSVQENLKVLLENQISFDVDLKEISASISATGEQLRSEYTQIKEDLEGNISDLNSSITQTAEEIRLEVNEVQTNLDGKIEENASLIQQTAEQIRLEVSEEVKTLDGKIEENTSSITQTANEIRLEVESVTTNLDSKIDKNTSSITQTASEIRSEVSKSIETLDGKINENSTSISQTAESITVLASKTEELENKNVEYDSKFVQTAEQIEAVVGRVETTEESIKNVNSSITQTAEQIRSEVNKSIEEVNGSISDVSSSLTQTAESIRSEVAKEVETLSGEIEKNTTSITQNADSINLRVESLEDTLNSKTSELEGKITKNTSEIALNKERIGLKVNTDVFDVLAGTVEQQGASIEINTNSIKNKVEQSSFNAFTGEVSNQFTEVNQSIEGIITTIQDNTGKITVIEKTVDGLTSKTGTLEAEIDSLKKQSDGSIDTHFGTTAPTLNNEPAVNWDTDELKNEHTGDIYYNNNTGEAYRFSYDPQTNTYFWVELTDSALTDALDKISKLEEAIDGKVTIFYTQPSNYKYGDIWFVNNSSYSPYKEGSLLTATNLAKDAVVESFNLNHWVLKADIVKSLNDLDKTVTDAFKDNIITIAEVDAIKESKKSFESSFQELTSAHAIVIATTLGNSTKLKTAYSNLENKYNAFIQSIDSLILDSNGNLSDVLLQAYTTAYNDYVEALKNYSKAKEELTDSIQKELSSANDYIKDISSDGVITPVEKKNLIEIWRSIAEEFNTNKGIAINYKIIDSEGNERTDIYSDGIYYSNYALYEAAFDEIKTIFTSDIFGISNTTTSTTLPEGYSTNTIDDALNNYYDTLSVFAEMISKITIEITDAHEKVLQLSKELQEQLSPSDSITQIGKGVILSSIIGVQSNGVLQAGLNATNINGLVDTSKDNHGRIVFAGGINGATDWNTANTVIYEDGYVHFRWGEIDEGVEIGNALIRSVVSGTIDLFSYPENGTLVPLFIVNKDNTGKIVSISTPYDFIANKNLIVHGDTSSGGEGGEATIGVTGIIVDGKQFTDKNSDGYIDLSEAFVGLSPTITSTMITEALGYTPLSTSGGTISGDTDALKIVRNTNGYSSITYYNIQNGVTTLLGVMGFDSHGEPSAYRASDNTWRTLLHSGNIESYAPVRKARQSTIDLNTASNGFYEVGYSGQEISNRPSGTNNGLFMDFRDANGYAKIQFYGNNTTNGLYFRTEQGASSSVGSAWKQIAFTDSNVASAQEVKLDGKRLLALYDNRLYVGSDVYVTYPLHLMGNEIRMRYGTSGAAGMILNSSGNVTIGNGDLAGTSYKLHVSGRIKAESAIYNNRWVTDGAGAGFVSNKGGTYCFGFGASAVNGSNVSFGLCKDSAGTWQQELMTFVESSGNVGIGTTTPKCKLDVNGLGRFIDGLYVYGTELYVDTKAGFTGNVNINGAVSMASTLSVGGATTINGDVRINGNLIITGDTASGGGTGESAIGISGILLNGTTYRDENGDGIINLGTIGGGTLTGITYEMIVEALGYTPLSTNGGTISGSLQIGSDDNISTVQLMTVRRGHYASFRNTVNEMILSFGETGASAPEKMLAMGNSGLRYSTDGGSTYYDILTSAGGTINGSLTLNEGVLYFISGGKQYAYNVNTGNGEPIYLKNDAWQTLLHSGNYSDYALPLSGGTITGNLIIQAGSGDVVTNSLYPTVDNAYTLGNGSRNWNNIFTYLINGYTPIHAGNYSYFALPLSGGTINGLLTISRSPSVIKFAHGTKTYGFIGVNTIGPVFYDPNSNAYDILTSAGGTINGTSNSLLTINSTAATSYITFQRSGANKAEVGWDNGLGVYIGNSANGYCVGVRDNGTPVFYDTTFRTLLHSGNIGEYNAGGLVSEYLSDVNAAGYNKVFSSGFQATNRPSGNYATGLTIYNAELKYTYQLAFSTSGKLFTRYNNNSAWQDWKTIAFTDSNVASAQALKHSNGTVGATAYADGKVYFDNGVLLKNNSGGVYSFDKDGEYRKILFLGSDNNMYVGFNTQSDPMRIYGSPICFFIGGTDAMRINSSGNVTIGASDKAGASDKLYVDGHMVASWLYFKEADGTYSSYVGRGSSNSDIYLYSKATLKMYAGSSAAMIINSSGNVTIGSVDTAATISGCKLFVGGDTYVGGKFTLRGKVGVSSDYVITNQEANGLHLYVAGNTGTFFAGNGNVLIGTTTDDGSGAKLQVAGNAVINGGLSGVGLLNFSAKKHFCLNDQGHFVPNDKTSTDYWWGVQRQDGNYAISVDADDGDFLTRYTTYLAISSGNVGIGTTDPQCKLDVAGDARVRGAVTMASTLSVTGATTLASTLTVSGNTTLANLASASHVPLTHIAYSLGSATNRWAFVYAGAGNFSGVLTVGAAATIKGNATINGSTTIDGNLVVKGDISA